MTDVTAAKTPSKDRPDFKTPPVVEVALSVGFDPIAGYTSAHSGLFWSRLADDFPDAEDQAPLAIPDETEGLRTRPTQGVAVTNALPPMRTWLKSDDGSSLIQLQRDVFAHNWRKTGADDEYPRYPSVRARFEDRFRTFGEFTTAHGLGAPVTRRCDVTYVNHVPTEEAHVGRLDEVLAICDWPTTAFLPIPEQRRTSVTFPIRRDDGTFVGRLVCEGKPGKRKSDGQHMFVISLTARGAPIGDGVEGVLGFFDVGRDWIVRGFADLTTPAMHESWGRIR